MAKKRANGEGNIRKRKDGRWEGRYTAGHDPVTGKQIIKNVLGKTQAEVKEKLKKALVEAGQVDFAKSGKYTVGTWMDEWFENVAKIKVRPSSHQTYKGYIELATGLRRGELLGLKWSDIDWKNGIIKVRRQVARVDGQIVEAPLKTKNSYRAVTISPQAIEVLKQQKAKTKELKEPYIFPSLNGGPISPDSVNNMLKRVLERAGIPKVRFHDLRHTFATIALQNGVDIKTVSGMLGHFSAGFTLDTYAHVTTSAQKEAAQTMGNILSM